MRCVHESPPSRETYRPLPGPPLMRSHGSRRVCHSAGEQDARIVRIETDVGSAGVFADEQHALPRLAAVGGAIDAALLVGAEGVAKDRGISNVGIRRMHDHGADLPDLLPDVLPRFAGVGRFVDAVARLDVAANVRLAGADVDHVRVRRRDGEGADGRDRLVVEDRLPVDAAVGRFPDAAGRGGGVIGERIAGDPAGPRATRPPAAGPTRRNLSRLNSVGPPFGPSSSSARTVGATAEIRERKRRKRRNRRRTLMRTPGDRLRTAAGPNRLDRRLG